MIIQYPDLENKKVLVTGATRGIGKALVQALATQKAHVVFNYREGKEELAEQLKSELLELGASKVSPLLFDLKNSGQVKDVLSTFLKEEGPIEGLVNNAGISKDQLFLRLKEEDLEETLDVNLKGPILLTSILSRGFLKANNPSIVNVSSIVGLMGNAGQASYSASKAGLVGLSKSVAKEMAAKNIRCNAICPGFIETDMTNALDDKVKESYLSTIPLKRFGSVKEVANLVNFLLSNASSYITGEVIKVDGGIYI